ncbi:MAG: cobalt ECF transporter T component CbiQ [Candidatus Nanopelagicaceae bacterium]
MHGLPAHLKILALLGFLLIVVTTPITHVWSYLGYFTLIISVILIARLPLLTVFRRSLIEIPFVLFALLMPFFGTGESYEVAGFTLYREGILAGTAIVAKGTLGVLGAITLSSTSTAREILRGLERLHLPALMVNIASFMLRYLNVVTDEMERMRIARASRGFEARGIRDWRILSSVIATLFMRSYERGERVHLAMLSRGFTGVIPRTPEAPASRKVLVQALALPLIALLISLIGRIIN